MEHKVEVIFAADLTVAVNLIRPRLGNAIVFLRSDISIVFFELLQVLFVLNPS